MTEALFSQFSESDIQRTAPALKVGILATVTPQGLPHLTLISTLMACAPTWVVWGQFMEGQSKENVRANPRTGFLIMTLDKVTWRGTATYSHPARAGAEYDYFNNVPMFRYNAYFGVHTVHYMDLVAQTGPVPLPMNKIIFAAVQTLAARSLAPGRAGQAALNGWTRAFFNKLDNLKFLSYVDAGGFPQVVPLIQAQSRNPGQLIFSGSAYGAELGKIPREAAVAVFGMSLQMEDVLVRGTYRGRQAGALGCGVLDVDWVYNPMPPAPMQIFPQIKLKPVTDFS
jgi:hypothetical protein